jgi:hypothetical protein
MCALMYVMCIYIDVSCINMGQHIVKGATKGCWMSDSVIKN